MKTQDSTQTSSKMRKALFITAFISGVIAIAFTSVWLSMDKEISYPSSPAELEAQLEFQRVFVAAQEEFQLKMDAAMKEASLKTDSLLEKTTQHTD